MYTFVYHPQRVAPPIRLIMTEFRHDEIYDIKQEEFVLKSDPTKVTSVQPPDAFVKILNDTSFVKEDKDLFVEDRVTMALLHYLLFTNSKPYATLDAEYFREKTFARSFLSFNKWQWMSMKHADEYIKKISSDPLRKFWTTRKNLRKRKGQHSRKGVQYLASIPLHLAYRFLWFLSTSKDATPATNTFWQLVTTGEKTKTRSNSEIDQNTIESRDFKIRELQQKLTKHENVGAAVAFDFRYNASRTAGCGATTDYSTSATTGTAELVRRDKRPSPSRGFASTMSFQRHGDAKANRTELEEYF